MKHLKHINEIDSWATPNRLGGDYKGSSNPNIEKFIEEYPVVINRGHISHFKYFEEVIQLARRLYLSKDDLEQILKHKDVMLRNYLESAFERYEGEYL